MCTRWVPSKFSLWARRLHLKAASKGVSHLGACLVSGRLCKWPALELLPMGKTGNNPNVSDWNGYVPVILQKSWGLQRTVWGGGSPISRLGWCISCLMEAGIPEKRRQGRLGARVPGTKDGGDGDKCSLRWEQAEDRSWIVGSCLGFFFPDYWWNACSGTLAIFSNVFSNMSFSYFKSGCL